MYLITISVIFTVLMYKVIAPTFTILPMRSNHCPYVTSGQIFIPAITPNCLNPFCN